MKNHDAMFSCLFRVSARINSFHCYGGVVVVTVVGLALEIWSHPTLEQVLISATHPTWRDHNLPAVWRHQFLHDKCVSRTSQSLSCRVRKM